MHNSQTFSHRVVKMFSFSCNFLKYNYFKEKKEQGTSHRLHSATYPKLRTQCVCKNIKKKAYVQMIAHNLNALCSEPVPSFPGISKNSENCKKLQNCRYEVHLLESDYTIYTFL